MDDTNLERALRNSLHQTAEQISPRPRRTEILAMTRNHYTRAPRAPRSWSSWLIPAAAAVSVALIGAIAWGATNPGGPGRNARTTATAPTATTTRTQVPQLQTPTPRAGAAVPNPITPNPAGVAGIRVVLPAYFVGATTPTSTAFGLYREFVEATLPAGATPAAKAKAALAAAMNARPYPGTELYIQPWSGTQVENVTLTPALITITLSGPGQAITSERRLAVAELVWTATAAVGGGNIPVRFAVADGSTALFGDYPTSKTYTRPAKELTYQELAPIWITSPARDQILSRATPVVVKGESCAFEATTAWALKKGGTTIKSGTTMASSGCPSRGTWSVALGKLVAGRYTFTMHEDSMREGAGVVAETSKPFTVK